MFDCFKNQLTLSGTLTTQTALRIGAGKSTDVAGSDLAVVRDALGRPYIPGSSLKGVMRAQVEARLRALVPESRGEFAGACNPVGSDSEWCLATVEEAMQAEGLNKDSPDKQIAQAVEKHTCMVCRVFGSHWMAAKACIRDLQVDKDLWFGQFETRNGVALDRDTETASTGLLYDFEVVPVGTEFACQIVLDNAEPWELGLLMAGLLPFERGQAALGGARSRGLGQVQIAWETRTFISANDLLDYLLDPEAAHLRNNAQQEQIAGWLRALREQIEERQRKGQTSA